MPRITDKEKKKLQEMDARREDAVAKADAPPIVAFSMRHPKGTNWEFVQLEIKDGKVVKESVKPCDDKDHAVESFRIAFVNEFIYGK